MADYPNYSTTPVTILVSGTNWTIDVTPLSLDTDLSVIDFAVYQTFNGNRIPQNELQKTASTTITYVGPALQNETEVVAMRSTPLSRYQFIKYASEFKSVVYNTEIDWIYTLLAEYTQLSKFLLENFILHPVPMVDELGRLTWDLDGDGEPDPEIPPVNIRGPVGVMPQENPGYTDVSQLPPPSEANVGHGYIIDGILYVSDGTNWVNFGNVAGPSAYDLWLAEGNTGTLQEYLTSLEGASAYDLWLAEGNVGTPQDYFNSLVGSGLELDGTVDSAANLPTDPVVPVNQIYLVQDTKEFYISDGDGTWTNLGVLYTPIPVWSNGTQLAWDLTGDGIADTDPVELKGEGIPAGGENGQILVKQGSTDFVAQWVTPSEEPDLADLINRITLLESRLIVRKSNKVTLDNIGAGTGSIFNWISNNFIRGSVKVTAKSSGGGGGGGFLSLPLYVRGGSGGNEGNTLVYNYSYDELSPSTAVILSIGAGGSFGGVPVEGLNDGVDGINGGDVRVYTQDGSAPDFTIKGGLGGLALGRYRDASDLGINNSPNSSDNEPQWIRGELGRLCSNAYIKLQAAAGSFSDGGKGGGSGGGFLSGELGVNLNAAVADSGCGGSGASVVVFNDNTKEFSRGNAGAAGYILFEWLEYAQPPV